MNTNHSKFCLSLFSKLFCLLILSILCFSHLFAQTGMRGITAMQATQEMAPGVNLYNTLDATNWSSVGNQGLESETVWGNPYTTPEMIAEIAKRGFKTLRLPVTWYNHMGPYPDYTIDEAWMDRVEEIANYALDCSLYVIINIHHDDYKETAAGSWLCPTFAKKDTVTDQLEKVWLQIATRFRDYDDYVIFETMNEPRETGSAEEWTGGSDEHREIVNAYNLAAVNVIRGTGGNNETRFIMIPQIGASVNAALENLIIPNEDPNIIVSTHSYSPFNFCLNSSGTARWGTSQDKKTLRDEIKLLGDHFVKNGIPVVMGEWGATNKDNYGDRIIYYDVYTNACKENGITPIAWIYEFDRRTLTWKYPMIEDAILFAYDSTVVDVEEVLFDVISDTVFYGDSLQLAASVLPEIATSQAIAWTTHDSKKATVDSSGLFIAKNSGKVKITATAIGRTKACYIYVVDTLTHMNFHIEAEDYYYQSGTQTENCSDENGGLNVGYIEDGDECNYIITIDSSGIYDFTARVATNTNGGTIESSINNNVLGSIEVDGDLSTGWQDWYTTEPIEINLDKGGHFFKLKFKGGSGALFNMNWFKLYFNRPLGETSVEDKPSNTNIFKLSQNYPNPFNPKTVIGYRLSEISDVQLDVYNAAGQHVRTLVSGKQSVGSHQIQFNASGLSSGIYVYQLKTKKFIEKKKMLLLK